MPRGAQMFVPNLWFRLEHQPANYKRLRIEGEIAGVVGNMKYGANTLAPADRHVDRKIRQIAAALEIDYTNFAWTVGANAGFASGRKAGGNPGLGANYDTDLAADERFTAFRSEEHTSELQSRGHLVCRLLLEKKKQKTRYTT